MENLTENTTPSQGTPTEQVTDTSVTANLDGYLSGNSNPEGFSDDPNNKQTQDADPLTSVEIDPKYKDLPREEALARTFQSKYDKRDAEYNKLYKDYQEYEKLGEVLKDIQGDEQALIAFVNQIKPGLLQPKDPSLSLKETLTKEFGEGYKPQMTKDEALMQDPFGKDAQYWDRVEELKQQLKQGDKSQGFKSLKDYYENQKKAIEAENKKYEADIAQAKQKWNLTDDEVKNITEFGSKLNFTDLTRIFKLLQKFPGTQVKAIENISNAGNQSITSPQMKEFLNSYTRKR